MKWQISQIRQILSDQIDDLRAGKTEPNVANAMCNTVGKLFQSIKIEIEALKVAGRKFDERFLELTVGKQNSSKSKV